MTTIGLGSARKEARSIVPREDLCIGCRLCEMACSQHHRGAFGRAGSSIYVNRQEGKGVIEITVSTVNGRDRMGCDLCPSLQIPACIAICPMGALAVRPTSGRKEA